MCLCVHIARWAEVFHYFGAPPHIISNSTSFLQTLIILHKPLIRRDDPLRSIDIVDENLKLILGMIWTLILRFTIADIKYVTPVRYDCMGLCWTFAFTDLLLTLLFSVCVLLLMA